MTLRGRVADKLGTIAEDAGRERGVGCGARGGGGRHAIETEEGDGAGLAFIEDGEIGGVEAGDSVAFFVEDGDGDFHQFRARAEDGTRGLLGKQERGEKGEGDETHLGGFYQAREVVGADILDT